MSTAKQTLIPETCSCSKPASQFHLLAVLGALAAASCTLSTDPITVALSERMEVVGSFAGYYRVAIDVNDSVVHVGVDPLPEKRYRLRFVSGAGDQNPLEAPFSFVEQGTETRDGRLYIRYLGIGDLRDGKRRASSLLSIYYDPKSEQYHLRTFDADSAGRDKHAAIAAMRKHGLKLHATVPDHMTTTSGGPPTLAQIRALTRDDGFLRAAGGPLVALTRENETRSDAPTPRLEGTFTTARYCSPAEFLRKVTEVQIHLRTTSEVQEHVPVTELLATVTGILRGRSIAVRQDAPVTLDVHVEYSRSHWDLLDSTQELHGLTVSLAFKVQTPVLRGNFRWMEVAPASAISEQGWRGRGTTAEGIRHVFPNLVADCIESAAKGAHAEVGRGGPWYGSLWTPEKKREVDALFSQALRSPTAPVAAFDGVTGKVGVFTKFRDRAPTLLQEDLWRDLWERGLKAFAGGDDTPAELTVEHYVSSTEENVAEVGAAGSSEIKCAKHFDTVTVRQAHVVYALNGELLRGDAQVWASARSGISRLQDAAKDLHDQAQRGIMRFAHAFAERRP